MHSIFSSSEAGKYGFKSATGPFLNLNPTRYLVRWRLFDDEPRSATAIAVTDVELVPVFEKQFLFLAGQIPYFALKVMRVLAQRPRKTNKTFG